MIDARTAGPEPALHAATLLSRTRLTQVECAARLGISERMLRYYVASRPMPYALRVTFERLAEEQEYAQRLVEDFRAKYPDIAEAWSRGGKVDTAKFTGGFDLRGPELMFQRHRVEEAERERIRKAMVSPPIWAVPCRARFDGLEVRTVRCPNPQCNEGYSPILDACPACGHPNNRVPDSTTARYRK